MVWKVKFSSRAENNLVDILQNLEDNWSISVSKNFVELLESKIQIIKSFPYSFSIIDDKKSIRRCVITKQISLYYEVTNELIFVFTLFDSRQDPAKLNLGN